MRGSAFLAVFLILTGIVFMVATLRGRAPMLYDAISGSPSASSTGGAGTTEGRQMPTGTRAPRTSGGGIMAGRQMPTSTRPPRKRSA